MSTIRTSNLGPLTGNTATVVDPATPTNGIARVSPLVSFEEKSASGTTVEFTGIPSWTRKITIILDSVSTNGSANILIQIGSGTYATSGYTGSGRNTAVGVLAYTAGFGIYLNNSAASITSGVITVYHVGSNKWVAAGASTRTDTAVNGITVGDVTLGGALDRIRLITTNGTDTFDGGSVNVMYE